MARAFQTYESRKAARNRAAQRQRFASLMQSSLLALAFVVAHGAAAWAFYEVARATSGQIEAAAQVLKGIQP